MYEIENASVYNGILIGDKNTHIYNSENGTTHEGGYGISIIACKNVKINNIEIYDMTGDGINVYAINKGEKICQNIEISDNNIWGCRRQGITIGCGEGIIIKNNEIHDINGTAPQSAIDLEGNYQTEIINNVVIENNKIYNLGDINALMLIGYIENVKIKSNEIEENILIYDAKDTLEMKNNIIKNSNIRFSNDYTNINAGHNIKNVIFQYNKLEDSSLYLSKVEQADIEKNEIKNGKIENVSSNSKIHENSMINNKENIEVAIDLSNIIGHTEKYIVQIFNNKIGGNYNQYLRIDEEFYTVK